MSINFNDPIHGRIVIPDTFRPIIESEALARLRNIRQLGFTLVSYPGAVHTRYEHTLGTTAVIIQLMKQLNAPKTVQQFFIRAALLKEVGITPLSHSSRPIFEKYGLSTADYAKGIYDNYLKYSLSLGQIEEEFIFDKDKRRNVEWFKPIIQLEEFSELDPVSLASRIDYVLRDSYYTGRYGESFDYRFFSSLVIDGSKKGEQELRKGLQALHRSAHALNATYGEPTRRILTILLQRLVDRLVSSNFLDLNYLKNPGGVFELDDDEFLYKISSAVLASGDDVLKRIHNIVIQRVAPETKTINLAKMGFSRDTDVEEIRDKIACSLKIPSELVILFDPQFDDQIGYRMFGKKFSSYEDALKNSSFSKLTGLALDEKEATRSNEEILVFLIS